MARSTIVAISRPIDRFKTSARLQLAAVTASAGLAGSLFYGRIDGVIAGQPAWLFAGLLYASAIGLSAVAIFRFLPNLRGFVVLTAISRLVLALASALVPAVAVALTGSPLLNATLVILGAVLIRAAARSGRVRSGAGFRQGAQRAAP